MSQLPEYKWLVFEFSGQAEVRPGEETAISAVISFLNGEAELIARDIGLEVNEDLARILVFPVDSRVEIRFHEGSINWDGIVTILDWMARIGGTLGLIDTIARIIRHVVDRVLRRWLNRIPVAIQSIEVGVVGPGARPREDKTVLGACLTWLNDNLGLLQVIWILVTIGSVLLAAITLRQLYTTSKEPELSVDLPMAACESTTATSENVRTTGPFIPGRYTVKTCRIRVRNKLVTATDIRIYVSLNEDTKLFIKRVGAYGSSSSEPRGWGPSLSSLRWELRTPAEQTEPRDVELVVGQMLADETIDVRLDIAYDPAIYKRECKRNLYLYVTAREVSKIGKAVATLTDLCP